jgi:thiosulfate/3-mercaptopyruvate sulfurtransferase
MRLLLPAAVALLASQLPAMAEPLVSPAWLAAHRTDAHVVVLDIRPRDQHAAGHIPAAVSAPFEGTGWRTTQADGAAGALPPVDQIAATISGLGVGDQDLAVIVGNDVASEARIYWTFKVLGHGAVSILDGGQKAWVAAGDPVETAPVTPTAAHFTPHLDQTLRASLEDVEDTVAHGGQTLVDARPVPQFEGKVKTPVVRTFGHLPGAVSIDQTDALTADGTALKPKAELAALFAKAGDQPVTTYCNTGHLSSTDWFVLSEILHHPHTRMYDGSMSQWTSNDSRPVVK